MRKIITYFGKMIFPIIDNLSASIAFLAMLLAAAFHNPDKRN